VCIIVNFRLELETKLQEIERRRIDEESQKHADREKVDERIRQAEEKRQEVEKELLVVKLVFLSVINRYLMNLFTLCLVIMYVNLYSYWCS